MGIDPRLSWPRSYGAVACEAGFVGYLRLKQAYARSRRDEEAERTAGDAARSFLAEHLAFQAEPLSERLESCDSGYLSLAARALLARVGPRPSGAGATAALCRSPPALGVPGALPWAFVSLAPDRRRRVGIALLALGLATIVASVIAVLEIANGPGSGPKTFAERRGYDQVKVDVQRSFPLAFLFGVGGLGLAMLGARLARREGSNP